MIEPGMERFRIVHVLAVLMNSGIMVNTVRVSRVHGERLDRYRIEPRPSGFGSIGSVRRKPVRLHANARRERSRQRLTKDERLTKNRIDHPVHVMMQCGACQGAQTDNGAAFSTVRTWATPLFRPAYIVFHLQSPFRPTNGGKAHPYPSLWSV